MIPEGWAEHELGEIATFKGGCGFKESYQGKKSGEWPFIKVSDMNLPGNEQEIFHSQNWVDQSEAKAMRASPMPPRAVVFAKVGAALMLNRRRRLTRPTIIDNNMMAAIPDEEMITSDFLFLHMKTVDLGKYAQASAVPSVNQQHLANLEIILPPLPEQQRIAEILATWDRAIETVEALIANARTQKKALMQQLLTGTKRLPGFEDAWTNHDFGEIAQAVKTKVDPRALPDDALGIELEHIESETGRLVGTCRANEQLSLKTPFMPGNILYGKLRPYLRKFSKPDFCGVCSTEIWVLAVKPKRCLPEYLHFLVQSPTFEGAVDVSSGSKMPRADWDIVSDTVFSTPSIPEQAAIAALLNDADRMLGGYESQLTALRQEKSALMQQLLTGKRRVKVELEAAA